MVAHPYCPVYIYTYLYRCPVTNDWLRALMLNHTDLTIYITKQLTKAHTLCPVHT